MRSGTVIELSQYRKLSPDPVYASARRREDELFRVRRQLLRIAAAVEAAVTVCIGAGFLVCLGLVISML